MAHPLIGSATAKAPRIAKSPLSRLAMLLGIHRERRALHHLDDALLRDIGLTRHEARTEARRPAWDAPERWRA
ncbi:DUF1127 domain-containing protein [Pseudooceanicola sediminis]|uniref:DUF1127 domain-containing protein n=1 Tax=Pseudooceanicola sediminis TaxID=2211117 RepID=A0A399IZR0_9RHOB|nr:DUF1127 domain-containing protein [Pseudooceanicola sediminis]KAA2313636.1 DUF1127 domain-containing protein [Puniceibacterium sp. HSS470]RII38521.1 DUF1127 domain-containing protein [Pseudooceanicola sediminis]|tara:strand:- start:29270 stop:29488 length:219 start_codon:yes stop_codon:yes gene_type:complete